MLCELSDVRRTETGQRRLWRACWALLAVLPLAVWLGYALAALTACGAVAVS